MQLKSERELYRRRRRWPWLRWVVVLALLVAGGYVGYSLLLREVTSSVGGGGATPVPTPTATPSPALYVAEAEDAYWAGELTSAIDAYQHALDIEPNQAELYLELARLLVFAGKPERALTMTREALRRQPESARAWALLCLAYDWMGVPRDGIDACEQAIKLDPTLPEAYAYLAEAQIDTGNWYAANATIGTALELAPDNVDVLRNQGYVLENQGNYYGAIESYREALEVHGGLAHLHMAIGRNASALGNLTLALEAYADAVDADPENVLALDRLGWAQLLAGDYDEAERNLTAALDLDPKYADAQGHLGTLYFQQRNYEGAIEAFRPAIRLGEARSRRITAFFLITVEDYGSPDGQRAGPEIARAEFVHPAEVDAPLRGMVRGVGNGAEIQGHLRLDVLSGRYELALTGMPPVPSGKVYVGWFVPLSTPEGLPIYSDPIFPTPDGRVAFSGDTGAVEGPPIEHYYTLALSYYLLDRCSEAMPYIETALRIDPEDANARTTLELCQ